MYEITPYIIVFLGGMASIFSPCILPLIPIYFSVLSKNSKNLILSILLLLLGFISAFFLMQILIFKFTNIISQLFSKFYLNKVLGIIIITFSLHTIGILKINFLNKEKRQDLPEKFENNSYFFPFLLGLTLGFGWTPCTGPILFTVMGYAVTSKNIFEVFAIMGMYSIGFALPFLILSFIILKLKKSTTFLNRYLRKIQVISGIALFLVGIAMFFDKLTLIYSL